MHCNTQEDGRVANQCRPRTVRRYRSMNDCTRWRAYSARRVAAARHEDVECGVEGEAVDAAEMAVVGTDDLGREKGSADLTRGTIWIVLESKATEKVRTLSRCRPSVGKAPQGMERDSR